MGIEGTLASFRAVSGPFSTPLNGPSASRTVVRKMSIAHHVDARHSSHHGPRDDIG